MTSLNISKHLPYFTITLFLYTYSFMIHLYICIYTLNLLALFHISNSIFFISTRYFLFHKRSLTLSIIIDEKHHYQGHDGKRYCWRYIPLPRYSSCHKIIQVTHVPHGMHLRKDIRIGLKQKLTLMVDNLSSKRSWRRCFSRDTR